jgi:hypothetical protein
MLWCFRSCNLHSHSIMASPQNLKQKNFSVIHASKFLMLVYLFIFFPFFKGIVSRDWGGLLMVLWDKNNILPHEVYFFFKVSNMLIFRILKIQCWALSHLRAASLDGQWAWHAEVQLHPGISRPLLHYHLGTPASSVPLVDFHLGNPAPSAPLVHCTPECNDCIMATSAPLVHCTPPFRKSANQHCRATTNR